MARSKGFEILDVWVSCRTLGDALEIETRHAVRAWLWVGLASGWAALWLTEVVSTGRWLLLLLVKSFVLLFAPIALLLAFLFRSRRVVLDRAVREAGRRFARGVDAGPLDRFVAVQVRSGADDHLERLARRGEKRGYILPYEDSRRIVLVARDGSRWPVTRFVHTNVLATDLDATAAEIARFLGLPVTRPPEPSPPGTIPLLT